MRALSSLLLGLGICILVGAAPVPESKDAPPVPMKPAAVSEDEIKKAIADLSSARFAVRDKARKFLNEAGAPAEALLKEAAKSTDEEVASTARAILERFEWGLYPDTPADIREL